MFVMKLEMTVTSVILSFKNLNLQFPSKKPTIYGSVIFFQSHICDF